MCHFQLVALKGTWSSSFILLSNCSIKIDNVVSAIKEAAGNSYTVEIANGPHIMCVENMEFLGDRDDSSNQDLLILTHPDLGGTITGSKERGLVSSPDLTN